MRFGIVVFMIPGLLTRSIGEPNNEREAGLDIRGFCSSISLPDRAIHTCETRKAENRSFAQCGRVSAQYQTRGTNSTRRVGSEVYDKGERTKGVVVCIERILRGLQQTHNSI
jgi:hypothetical protein